MAKLKHILLIDDDDINNFIDKRIITKLKLAEEIVVKKNGLNALDFLKETYPSGVPLCSILILLDTDMPVMDGIEFLKEFNKMEFLKRGQFVILLLAATLKKELLEEFFQNGIQEFTEKPLDEETILMVYNKYWDEKGEWKGQDKK